MASTERSRSHPTGISGSTGHCQKVHTISSRSTSGTTAAGTPSWKGETSVSPALVRASVSSESSFLQQGCKNSFQFSGMLDNLISKAIWYTECTSIHVYSVDTALLEKDCWITNTCVLTIIVASKVLGADQSPVPLSVNVQRDIVHCNQRNVTIR